MVPATASAADRQSASSPSRSSAQPRESPAHECVPSPVSPPLLQSDLKGLTRIHQGKVRDIYEIDVDHLLIVTTDRMSAFDVVLPDPIPGKGRVLTEISRFWFDRTRHIVPNHLATRAGLDSCDGRAGCRRAQPDRRPCDGRPQTQAVAHRGGRARLSHRVRLEGLPAHRSSVRHSPAGRACGRRTSCLSRSSRRRRRPPAGQHDENIGYRTGGAD